MMSMAYSFASGVAFALGLVALFNQEYALSIVLGVTMIITWLLSRSERELEDQILLTPLFRQLIMQWRELERLQQPELPLPATGSAEALVSNEEMKDS